MSDILKNNAISDDELGRVSGGVVDMTPEQREAAIAYIRENNLNFFSLEMAINAVSTMGYYDNAAEKLKNNYGIDSLEELIDFMTQEWANI